MVDPALQQRSPSEAAAEVWGATLDKILGADNRNAPSALTAVEPVSLENGTLQLQVPSSFHRERLVSRHVPSIQSALGSLGVTAEVAIVVAPQAKPDAPPTNQLSLGLDDAEVTKPGPPGDPLDPRLSFDTFIVGQSNRLAQAAALCVAENTAEAYNPLFIHGESGNGKTHLLNAIGLHVREHSPRLRVRYVTIERFTSEFIEGIKANRLDVFKRRYRACALLLVDDVQFLEGKDATQEEFFHTFNEVTRAGGRVVLTADRHPGSIPTLPERLISRFKSGLVADLQAPEFETRVAILRKKAEVNRAEMPDDVFALLASSVTRNVRELEGALIRVIGDARLENRPITVESARLSLEKFLGSTGRVLTTQRIIDEAADLFGVDVDDLKGPSRTRLLVTARQSAMYVCRSLTEESLPSIGRSFGDRDHTTVLHAVRKIEKLMTANSNVHAKVVELMNRLGGAPQA
ncbi:MAG: chromosomal replication initiator protein DnaA [Actinomycetota bacterium]|nr:chromosomal replication initiator protein DnaA [Actinomycetota bacterium]